MHVETGYFFLFGNILITAKNFRNRRKVLLTTIFYKSSGTFNETWTLILLAYNIFSKNSWFLFLDKSQVQKNVDFITCFSCTVKKQNFKSIQAHSWTPLSNVNFCLFTSFLLVLFVARRKNVLLFHLMNRYTLSTS